MRIMKSRTFHIDLKKLSSPLKRKPKTKILTSISILKIAMVVTSIQ